MSGGVAYLLDPDPLRISQDMAQLEPLDDGTGSSCSPPCVGTWRRRSLPSPKPLLVDPDTALERFGKVMPTDYKRVLQARAAANWKAATRSQQ